MALNAYLTMTSACPFRFELAKNGNDLSIEILMDANRHFTPARFRCEALRAHTPIKNLYFSGSEVATVGVMGAMAGGMVAAMAIEPIRVGRYIGKL